MHDTLKSCFAACIVVTSAMADQAPERTPERTVVRNIQILSLDPATPLQPLRDHTIIIDDGIITAIKPPNGEDLRAGDMLVDGGGAFAFPGFLHVVPGPALPYSDLTRFPLLGVTTVIGDFDPVRLQWYARLDREAAIHGPGLAQRVPADGSVDAAIDKPWERVWTGHSQTDAPAIAAFLRAKSVEVARRHGLADRGAIAVGQRGDIVIVAKHPAEDPTGFPGSLAEPIEVVIAGKTMRRSALETNRGMIAEADAAIASRPAIAADRVRYLIESSGLRVGELIVAPDGRSGEEWWGPPIRQTTTWSWRPRPVPPEGKPTDWSGWVLDLLQRSEHGFTIEMRAERTAARTLVTARMTAPESGPERRAEIEAIPDAPMLDPVSLLLAQRELLGTAVPEGSAIIIEVLEPIPEAGAVKFGIRRLLIRRLPAGGTPVPLPVPIPVPVDSGELLWRIEAEPSPAAQPSTTTQPASADGAISGWVVTDPSGVVLRASMIAPEGITEYFRSLPQPRSGSAPETKPEAKPE